MLSDQGRLDTGQACENRLAILVTSVQEVEGLTGD